MLRKHNKSIMFIMVVLIMTILTACGEKAKNEKEIAEEVAMYDTFFEAYELEIVSYKVDKRQTNEDDKIDYVWFTICGQNSEFEYSAEYELIYVLYNDGWQLEEIDRTDFEYQAKVSFDSTELEAELAELYDNISKIDVEENGNQTVLYYSAEENDEVLTTFYEIKAEAEFSPSAWEVTNVEETKIDTELDIVGEWIYTDEDGRYYYMHISDVNDTTVTINYLFANTSQTDEWNYISSNGYQEINLKTYFSEFTGAHDELLYFHLTNGSGSPEGMGGDVNFGYLWLEETLFVDGTTYCGFTINQKYLTRENKSETPVIGMDSTIKTDTSSNINLEDMNDEQSIIYLLNEGNIEEATEYIDAIHEKNDKVQSLENQIKEFNEMYGAYLGTWVEDTDYEPEEVVISCRYEEDLILCLVLGETIEGQRKLYDLCDYDKDYDVLVFHSERFDSDTYHYIDYNVYFETLSYHWEDPTDNLSTLGDEYIRK